MTLSPTLTSTSIAGVPLEPDAVDPDFAQPFVDIDEWRDEPVRHRYLHGGFHDNDTRFSLYLPEQQSFAGRFYQHVTPVPQSENLAQERFDDENPIPFTLASGGYYVETNGGGPNVANPMSGVDPSIGAYRANAAVARLSRVLAEEIYGEQRIYGYLYGGSGGGYRTIGASENTEGVWDGFVPYVIGSPMAIPNVFSIRMHAQRILRDAFPRIVDAYDAGGDPAALELSDDERAAFTEVSRMGFPLRSWFGWETMGMHAFSVLYPSVMLADPNYVEDFWNVDGYLGSDPDASVHRDRIRLATTVVDVVADATGVAVPVTGGVDESYKATATGAAGISEARLAEAPTGFTLGAELRIVSGASAGRTLRLAEVHGDTVRLESGQEAIDLSAGDEVVLDNSNFLAAQSYHRHQVPSSDYRVWDQFRTDAGEPALPQRAMLLGPLFSRAAAGTVPTGNITGKMIVVASLLDREAFPWQADWYRSRVADFLGAEADDRFRLWYTDNALHGDESGIQEHETRTVSYAGALESALRQLSAWVEEGTEPAPSTSYEVLDGQVHVDTDDASRGGVQPIVALTVNGAASADVEIGEAVDLRVTAEPTTPTGRIVRIARDFSGSGRFGERQDVEPARVFLENATRTFTEPGTYLVAVRVTAQTDGTTEDRFARVDNIARARITVRPAV